MARIDDCVKRFSGLIDRWDVVNEVTHYDREEFARHTAPKYTAMWKKYGQIAMASECFPHARQANPQGVLLINDYRTDAAYERVIEQLVDEKGRRQYDVIGIQSHMHGGVWSNGQVWKVCQQFRGSECRCISPRRRFSRVNGLGTRRPAAHGLPRPRAKRFRPAKPHASTRCCFPIPR